MDQVVQRPRLDQSQRGWTTGQRLQCRDKAHRWPLLQRQPRALLTA
jgi:hypothetical protein